MTAAALIGEADPDNDTLRTEYIKEAVDPGLTELRNILDHTRIQGHFKMRSDASGAAARAQSRFWWISLFSIIFVAITTLASALLLYSAGAAGEIGEAAADAAEKIGSDAIPASRAFAEYLDRNQHIILSLQIAGAALTAFATTILSLRDYAGKWNDNRRRAEDLRRQIFVEIFNQAATGSNAVEPNCNSLLSQVFELFRRFQLELQLNFYKNRSDQVERSSSWLSWFTAALAGLTALSSSINALGGDWLTIAAAMGIALPVLLSAAQSWRAVNLFGDKAKSYSKAYRQLQTLYLEVSSIREAAAKGEEATVRGFIDRVQEVMENENTNWVAAPESAD